MVADHQGGGHQGGMKRPVAGISEREAMKLPRRQFLHLAVGAAALPAVSRIAWAQAYPSRPVRIIVGFAPGGATDIMARLMGQSLSERLGQQFVIENRPGAASNVGTEAVVNAAPDGYTLLVVTSVNAINASLYEKLNFNLIRDVVPVASIHREPFVMEANPSVPVKTVAEFIAHAKANPGKINMASAGIGSGNHISGELFKMMTGVNLVHVPYRGGGPALVDLLGGQVQVMFATMSSSIEYVRAGKLRALAVTTATRSPVLPDIPTVAEFVPGYESSFWTGVGAPRNTPAEIVDKLNKEMNATLADPKFKARLADLGGTALSGSPLDFGKFVADETEKWAKVVKFAGIRAD
jgi:tripartite-type tricarboxylate transporter receptor subunit TctC